MPGKTRYPVFILCVTLLLLLQGMPVKAQQQPFLDKKVSFAFTATPLVNALRAISNKIGVKFSYNPDLVQAGRRVSMRFNNVALREILKQLLNDPSLSFREIGNQIVIYRGDPSTFPLEPNQQLIQSKPLIILPTRKNPDTVYIYQLDTLIINRTDTIFRSISITRFDTIRITDTVFLEKSKPPLKAGKDLKNNFDKNSVRHKKFLENNGFYGGLYFEMLPGTASYSSAAAEPNEYLDLMKQANSGKLPKFSTGIIAGYDYLKIGIRTGIGYTRLGEKFEYSYVVETGGFYKVDTTEVFYSIPIGGGDTTWTYLSDSAWIPKDTKNYSFRNPNTFKYVDVPLSVKFRFWQNESAEIYAIGGMNASFLISVDALHINPDNKNDVSWIDKKDLNPILLSWQAGVGGAIKFSTRTGMVAEALYRKQMNSQYKDFPVDKSYSLFALKIGAYVKF